MYFLPVLDCKNCHRPIRFPRTIQSQTFSTQSSWPWGTENRNVACLPCKHVCECSEPNSRWARVDNALQLEETKKTAVYLLSVLCGVDRCAGLIDILVVAKKELTLQGCNSIARSLYAKGTVCGNGHRSTGSLPGKSPITFRRIEDFWRVALALGAAPCDEVAGIFAAPRPRPARRSFLLLVALSA